MAGNLKQGFGLNAGGTSGAHTTNTNIANADLSLDGNHTTDTNGNTLTIDNGATNLIQLNSLGLSVGAATPYIMPTARAGVVGKTITSTNATTGTAWRTTGFTLPFTMYIQGCDSTDYHYPEPMSNNKFLALAKDSGLASPGLWNVVTSATLRACTLGGVPVASHISAVNFWASALDNVTLTGFPTVTVEIWSFLPLAGVTTQLVPESLISATTAPTGNSNNKFYLGRSSVGTDVAGNSLLMPVFKINFEEAPVPIDFDIWINGAIQGYYTS